MPTYHNPTGKKAYIMNMYTAPEYRRQGIAISTLDLLVKDVRKQGVSQIALEATEMGRPLYEKYGFVKMEDEMGADQMTSSVFRVTRTAGTQLERRQNKTFDGRKARKILQLY